MTWEARIFVPGAPRPKGNMEGLCPNTIRVKHGRRPVFPCRPIVTEDRRKGKGGKQSSADKLKAWTLAIQVKARMVAPVELTTTPVLLTATIFLERPKTNKRARPDVKPDADKIYRAIGDALAGVWYEDDKQVVNMGVEEFYAAGDDEAGSFIECAEVINDRIANDLYSMALYKTCTKHMEG